MAIKDLYNEAKSESSNKVKSTDMYEMPLQEFIDEHMELIKTLREGSREELLAEAKDQEDELKECLKEHNLTWADVENEDNEDY